MASLTMLATMNGSTSRGREPLASWCNVIHPELMQITVDLPDDIAGHSDPGREALEALASEGYRSVTHYQARARRRHSSGIAEVVLEACAPFGWRADHVPSRSRSA
jgi:hypothetical protein